MPRSRTAALACSLVILGSVFPASAADWIRPDWSGASQPRFASVAMFGANVDVTPLIYRVEVDVPTGCDRATAVLRTTDWAYVWVDGRQVSADMAGGSTDDELARRARNRLHWLDLTEYLTPGRHVLAVSASAEGFVLDGGLYSMTRLLSKLTTHEGWTVTKFAPATVVADHPIMTLAYDGRAAPQVCSSPTEVIAVDAWNVREDALAAAHFRELVTRLRQRLDDTRWRLELLTLKGIYIVDHQATGWGGPSRVRPDLAAQAAKMIKETPALERRLTDLSARTVRTVADLDAAMSTLQEVSLDVQHAAAWMDQATDTLDKADWAIARGLIEQGMEDTPSIDASDPRQWAQQYGQMSRLPLSGLNISRYDRYGWLPLPELADGDLRGWGVRVNPVAEPGRATADDRWLFATDPTDGGLVESRWRMSYPADEGWSAVALPHDWSRSTDAEIAAFKGVVWYRGRLRVPAMWAGLPVRVKLTVSGDERMWINNREITPLGTGFRKRTYDIPAEALVYGGPNTLAVRIKAEGPQRGMTGEVVATCPALRQLSEQQTPQVDVLATPLSPCVVLTPRTDLLRIYHGGTAALALPRDGGMESASRYSLKKGHNLSANWVLMWLTPGTPEDVRRPILLVFQTNPVEIRCSRGLTEIKLDSPGRPVVAVRPWARRNLSMAAGQIDLAERVRFWSRAARAIPVNYVCLTDIDSQATSAGGAQITQMILYDYLETTDEWATPALKIAPLPAPAALALDHGRTLTVADADDLQVFQDGGIAGAYRGFVGRTRVHYRYPVTSSRYVGFTYRAPSGTSSLDEVRLLGALGANSLRWRRCWDDSLALPDAAQPPSREGTGPQWADLTRAGGLRYVHTIYTDSADRAGRAYELFVEAVGRHYRSTASSLAADDRIQVGYDLFDVPGTHRPGAYGRAVRRITEQIRAEDPDHVIFVQPCGPGAGPAALAALEPTGDSHTAYGFRDGRFALANRTDRWPSRDVDISDISRHWWPAIAYGIRHGVDLHCTGFGNFPARTADSPSQRLLLNDMLRLIAQFAMHSHFDSAEDLYLLQFDGALRPTSAARAYRVWLAGPWVDPVYRPRQDVQAAQRP